MAESEFIDTVEKALKDKGVLDQLTCQVRAEILQVLKSSLKVKQVKNSIPESTNNFLINELIKGQLNSERIYEVIASLKLQGFFALPSNKLPWQKSL